MIAAHSLFTAIPEGLSVPSEKGVEINDISEHVRWERWIQESPFDGKVFRLFAPGTSMYSMIPTSLMAPL